MKKLAAFTSALALVFLMSSSTYAQASTPVKKVDAKEVKTSEKKEGKKDHKKGGKKEHHKGHKKSEAKPKA